MHTFEVTYTISVMVEASDASLAVMKGQKSDDMVLKQVTVRELDHHSKHSWSEELMQQIRG